MRSLTLLALAVFATLPLAAHDHGWRRPRRVVIERDVCRDSYRPWDEDRWAGRGYYRRYAVRGEDCDDRVVFGPPVVLRPWPGPLPPPFRGRVELWIH